MFVNAYCGWFHGISGNLLCLLIFISPLLYFRICAFGVLDVVGVGCLNDGVFGKTLGVLFTELLQFCVPWVGVLLLCTNAIVDVSSSNLDVRGVFFAILKFPKSKSFL